MAGNDEGGDLPASLAIERSLLGTLLLKSELWKDAVEAVRPDDFSLDAHRLIFRAMHELGRSQGSFDETVVATKLERELPNIGGIAYLSDLACGAIERSNVHPLCEVIREKAILRGMVRQGEALKMAALTPGTTLGECKRRAYTLLTLADSAQPNRLRACTMGEFLELELPAREMVLSPVIPAQGLVMLYSKRGLGKTYMAIGIALAVARGGSFLCWKASKSRKVLFVDGELPASTLQQRIRSVDAGVPESQFKMLPRECLRIITPDVQTQSMPDLVANCEGQMLIERELSGVELLILDNLSALCRSGKENEGESWLPVQEWLLRLRQQGHSVLLVHHAGKSGAQRGTSRREDLLDTVVALQHPSDYAVSDGLRCEVHYEKARGFHGQDARPFEVRMQLEGSGAAHWTTSDAEDALLDRAANQFRSGATIRGAAEELLISA
jgi:putative DNA primase/helicase